MFIIAGPCVIESEPHALAIARELARIGERLQVRMIFKASFDKANRTSGYSPRGPGLRRGLEILGGIRAETGLELLTDVHDVTQVAPTAAVVDVLQVPAFLCRQTDLVQAAVRSGRPVNVKKGQFMAPQDMAHVVDKARECLQPGESVADRLWLCERGTSFGYQDLVVDMRGLEVMRSFGCPVIFDASHAVQQPGAAGGASGGQRELIPALARAAVAVGVDGLFIETHPDPPRAWSDAATVWPLSRLEPLLEDLLSIDRLVKCLPGTEQPGGPLPVPALHA
ncbi:MAG: 3-deoxy-8-phosphooctulonate synthase [Pseudomonadota bacterium]